MKIIVSHDVDHITAWEHRRDLIIPKSILRGIIEFSLRYISFDEIVGRLRGIVRNKLQNIDELMTYDKSNSVPSTFFIGISNGNYLQYPRDLAGQWAQRIREKGFDVGVHGISYDNLDVIRTEYNMFKQLTGHEIFGIRMHYLNSTENTIKYLSEANYSYDSSVMKMSNPYKVNRLWEFPLHVMDTSILEKNGKWQSSNLEKCKDDTKTVIDGALTMGLHYFTILFHDIYFSDSYKTWKDWYMWLITYLRDNEFEFINYATAIKEIERFESEEKGIIYINRETGLRDIINESNINTAENRRT